MFKAVLRSNGENNNNYAYRAIKKGIVSLELQPGQLLSVGELTDALRVSSTPIKSALWKLQQEHLVDIIPQVGSYVSKMNIELIEEAASMWFNLEKEVLKWACNGFPENHLNQLKRNLQMQEMLVAEKEIFIDSKEWIRKLHELDKHFHALIFEGQRRNHTWKAIEQMISNYQRMMNLSQTDAHFKKMIVEHKEIVRIIEEKEIEQIDDVLRKHILDPVSNWKEIYKEGVVC